MTINEAAQILGIPLNATAEQLKKAYRKLSKQYHPDRNPDDKHAEEMFRKVNEANQVFEKYLKQRGNTNRGGNSNASEQSGNTGRRPGGGSGAGTRPGNSTGTRPGGNPGGGAGVSQDMDNLLKKYWQMYQKAKREHENFLHGELATIRQKVKDTESKLVQTDNLDQKIQYVSKLQRLLMQKKMLVARAVILAQTAQMYLKQYEDLAARINKTNTQRGR